MNKKWIRWETTLAFAFAIIVAVVLVWSYIKKSGQPNAGSNPVPQTTVIAPVRQIPTEVTQNMQEALAEREKKLQELQSANNSKVKAK